MPSLRGWLTAAHSHAQDLASSRPRAVSLRLAQTGCSISLCESATGHDCEPKRHCTNRSTTEEPKCMTGWVPSGAHAPRKMQAVCKHLPVLPYVSQKYASRMQKAEHHPPMIGRQCQ